VPTETQHEKRLSVPTTISGRSEDEFENHLRRLLGNAPKIVTLDCANLEQVSSRHVNLLWQAHLACEEAGVDLKLHRPSAGLIRVLQVLDLFHIFNLDDTCIARQLREAVRPTLDGANGTYSSDFTTDVRSVDEAVEAFIEYIGGLRLPEMTAFELRTVFYEVAMNITNHGAVGSREKVVFSAVIDDERIVMTFADSGRSFDPTVMTSKVDLRKAARGRQRRGFGLAMVSKLTDRMEYVRVHDAINLLTLEKRWSRN